MAAAPAVKPTTAAGWMVYSVHGSSGSRMGRDTEFGKKRQNSGGVPLVTGSCSARTRRHNPGTLGVASTGTTELCCGGDQGRRGREQSKNGKVVAGGSGRSPGHQRSSSRWWSRCPHLFFWRDNDNPVTTVPWKKIGLN